MLQNPQNIPEARAPGSAPKTKHRLLRILLACVGMLLSVLACSLPQRIPAQPTGTPPPTATPPEPTPTRIPDPTPVPTLQPRARVAAAEEDLFNGDYDAALRAFITTLEVNPGPEIEAAARLGIGRVQLLRGESNNALQSFRDLIARHPETPQAAEAQIFIGRILVDLQRYDEAAAAFQNYLDRQPGVLDAYVYVWMADALRAAGRPDESVAAYTAALETPRLPGNETRLQMNIAAATAEAGDLAGALEIYTSLSENIPDETLKPSLLLLRGELLIRQGQLDAGYALYQQLIAEYPRAFDAYTALLRLLDAGKEVNELDRGLVDYFVGEYSLAVFAFDRYLAGAETVVDGQALYYKGLSLRAIDSTDLAIQTWNTLIQTLPSSDPYWDDAWEEIGDTEWAFLGDNRAAIATYESFVARVPAHERAAEFLFFAAQIAEREGDLTLAVQYWERMISEYPTHWQVARAHFLAGITLYRIGNYGAALGHFQTIGSFTNALLETSQALFWVGKCHQALGDIPAANLSFEQAAAADPTGYYSERAADILSGIAPFEPPAAYDLAIDWEAERRLAEGWVRTTFSLPESMDLTDPGPLAGDIRFIRGTALWHLGFYEEARAEFESLRVSMAADPTNSFRLAHYAHSTGLYRTAIFSARQVLDLSGMDDAATRFAPPWFNYIRFGTYYRDLVLPSAQDQNLHPLFVWSVMRQESLFEGFVRSTAGARGLMQIIPSTGAGIHQNLGWPENYSAEDLYRPLISVTYGVDYLADQLRFFAGENPADPIDFYAALAAYNGGPGNATAWYALSQEDPDLFLEVIRFEETRRYVRGIYEIYSFYDDLYNRSP